MSETLSDIKTTEPSKPFKQPALHPKQVKLRQLEERAIKARKLEDLQAVMVDLLTMLRTQL